MLHKLRYLLLQVRNPGDPMREQEVGCFARVLRCPPSHVAVFDLLGGWPSPRDLARYDIVLLGGSGDYSVAEGGEWLEPSLEAMRELYVINKPTFASCWGFQAMTRALGGEVVVDLDRAEVGTHELFLTATGRGDPVFGPLAEAGPVFHAQQGHVDIVERLPDDAELLVSSRRVENQAFRFPGKHIYCTQFHPELDRRTLLERLQRYPSYIEKTAGMPYEQFARAHCHESPHTEGLLLRFVRQVAGVG
ncbi:MAG: type 1 glutamine amidotransferase [Planctomycetota bacterium]|jgi:GMP synthase (glutamine-hydrolysing)